MGCAQAIRQGRVVLLGTVALIVYAMFLQRQLAIKTSQVLVKHLVLEQGHKICISMRQAKVCPNSSSPSEVVPMQMAFFCVAKDQEGYTLKALAQSGEKINEAKMFPIAFTSTVHTARNC